MTGEREGNRIAIQKKGDTTRQAPKDTQRGAQALYPYYGRANDSALAEKRIRELHRILSFDKYEFCRFVGFGIRHTLSEVSIFPRYGTFGQDRQGHYAHYGTRRRLYPFHSFED